MIPVGVVSSGIFHPSLIAQWNLRVFLQKQHGYKVLYFDSIQKLASSRMDFIAVVLFYHKKWIDDQQLNWLANYLKQGGGILALHSASASFKKSDLYYELLGGRFIRHGPVQNFLVKKYPAQYEVFRPISDFYIVDELYIHEHNEGNQIHYFTEFQEVQVPVVWTREYGKGRLCYISFGHRADAFQKEPVQEILMDGLAWISRVGRA